MPPQSAMILRRKVVACAVMFFFIATVESSKEHEQVPSKEQEQVGCSDVCVAENCDSLAIKYGKYCGLGWSGCPGEEPCDDVDACCKIHDNCVGDEGMTNVECHKKFKTCITKVHKSGKEGFSKSCPYDTVVPTMIQGMDLAIMFSQIGGKGKSEL